MKIVLILLLSLALPAAAYHEGREALTCFWAMLPVAILYGPDFGLRLISQYPSIISPSLLLAGILGFSWTAFFSTTWFCASILELGMESGGAGLLAGHFAGGLPPWLAARWYPKPMISVAVE